MADALSPQRHHEKGKHIPEQLEIWIEVKKWQTLLETCHKSKATPVIKGSNSDEKLHYGI